MIETYVPLYRKYRPQQFGDLVGQEVVATAIGNALKLNKIAHAYLFCGPRGTGKTSSARILAKSLNCEQGPTITPCQTCPSCVSITAGNALDVTEIDAASNNSVDDIRDLTDKVQFSPIQGKFKVYIIDEVHMLTNQAFNALLKTLEEPPPNVVFIFATTEPHKVLPTIISRCQRFDFSRITRQQIEDRLHYVAEQEGIKISPEALQLIGRHVRGGMRDALGLLDQVSVLGRSEDGRVIQPEDVRAFIGALEEDILLDLTRGIIEKAPDNILSQLRLLLERGVEPPQLVKELTQHFRNLLIAKTCGPNASADNFDIAPDFYQKLCTQAEGFETEEIPQMLSRLSQMESQLRHSKQPQLWLEVGLLDLCYREEIYLLKQLAERVEALEAALQNGQVPARPQAQQAVPARPQQQAPVKSFSEQPVSKQVSQPMAETTVPPQPSLVQEALNTTMSQPKMETSVPAVNTSGMNLGQLWQQIGNNIQHSLTKAMIQQQFKILDVTENSILIGANETLYNTFKRDPKKSEYLEQAVVATLGKPYKINFETDPDVIAAKSGASVASEPAMVSQPVQTMPQTGNGHEPSQASEPDTIQIISSQASPKFEDIPKPTLEDVNLPAASNPLPEKEVDYEMESAKKYTQDLLQGRLLD